MKPIIKYEDDLGVFRSPNGSTLLEDGSISYSFPYDRQEALRRIAPLRIPWHATKGSDFAEEFIDIGFLWNIREKKVFLPEPKRLKFLGQVNSFIASFRVHRCQNPWFFMSYRLRLPRGKRLLYLPFQLQRNFQRR